jgi:putative ABC transport system permease protein
MIKNYFKTAWRNIVKNRTTTVINILGLTLGITACLIIYLDTSFELSYDNFHRDKERIYRVVTSAQSTSGEIDYKPTVPDPVAGAIRTDFTGIEKVAQFHGYYAKVTITTGSNETKTFDAANEREEETSDIIISDPEYFDIFKYQWIAGDAASMKDAFHVVLTESKAKKYFSSLSPDEIIGKKIIYNDSLPLFVSGIVKNYPKNSDLIFNDFISSATIQRTFLKDKFDFTKWQRWNKISQTFVKTAKGTTPLQFQTQTLDLVKKNMDIGDDTKISISLQPLSDIHFNTNYEAAYGREVHLTTLYGLMVIAIFILLIAAVNFINLSTAQSLQRAKEIGVRKVLGSSRKNLILQLLCETFILTALSAVTSLLIVSPIISALHTFLPEGVGLAFNQNTIGFILLVTLGISLLAGFYPAKVLSSYMPVLTLKGANFHQGSRKNYLRKGLIVFQFTISLIFIIGTLIIGNQIKYVLNTDMGFAKDAIINIPGNQNYPKEKMQILAQQIKHLAGVEMVSVDLGTPAEESHWSTILKSKELGDAEVGAEFQAGDENYISLYQLKLLTGRNLLASDTMKEYLINETLAKQLGFKKPEDAIGKTISSGGDDGTAYHKQLPIVGVLADFHSESLHAPIAPTFISTSKKYSRIVSVKLLTQGKQISNFKETIAKIEKLWKNTYPNEKFEYKFFDETIAKFYDKEIKTGQLMNAAMAIAIFISCMGLFGLATFTAQQRTKEIGIRKVLGANVAGIVSMLSMDFLKLVLLAFVIASPVAYYFMHQWLQNFAYRINISWWVFALAGLAAVLIALLTVSFQAIKAAIANPVKSLRTE